jgi:predicted nucleic acid-binding protein
MTRRRALLRLVIDTMVVIRAARAFRQQPPAPTSTELALVLAWLEDDAFVWLYSAEILDEYTEVLRRLKVPRQVVGRFVNLLRAGGELITPTERTAYSPDPKDDPFYHCALAGDADYIVTDNIRDFPPLAHRKRPQIVTTGGWQSFSRP